MTKEWRGINDFYFVKSNTQEQEVLLVVTLIGKVMMLPPFPVWVK